MIYKELYLSTLILSTLLISCGAQHELSSISPILRNNNVELLDLDTAEIKDSLYFSTYFKKPKTIVLKTNTNCIIKGITSVELYNQKLYILDRLSKALYVFGLDGHFIRQIGRRGKGHGEYNSIYDFTIDRKHQCIYLWDDPVRIAHKYDAASGEYLSSIKISDLGDQTSSIQYLNGKLFIDNMMHSGDEEHYSINEIDAKSGLLVAKYMESDRYNSGANFSILNQGSYFYSKNLSNPKFIGMFSDTIVALTQKGIQPIYAIKSKRFVDKNFFEDLPNNTEMLDYWKWQKRLDDKKRIYGVSSYVDLHNMVAFEYNDGNRKHYALYDNKNRKTVISPYFINDCLSRENIIPTRVCYSDKNGILVALDAPYIPAFIQYIITRGKLSHKVNQYNKLSSLKQNSNPVLFFHEYK